MKKKLLSAVLAFAMIGTMLTGCGNDAASDNATQSGDKNAAVEDAGSEEDAIVSQGKVVNI